MFCSQIAVIFRSKSQFNFISFFPQRSEIKYADGAKLISFTSHYLNSLSPSITVTTVLKAGLYTMGCLDVLRSAAGCSNRPLSKAGQLVQQCGNYQEAKQRKGVKETLTQQGKGPKNTKNEGLSFKS